MSVSLYGMRASRKGFPVDQVGHPELSFDSDLLGMKVFDNRDVDTPANWTANPSGITPLTHNLGYVPAFMLFNAAGANSSVASDFTNEFLMGTNDFLVWPNDSIANKHYRLLTFRLPLLTDFDAETTARLLTSAVGSGDYGITSSVEGHDVLDTTDQADTRNVAMSSELRTPFVHKVGGFSGSGGFTVFHGLGYNPLFLLYGKDLVHSTNRWQQITLSYYATADNNNIYFQGTGGDYRYVILKDPLL